VVVVLLAIGCPDVAAPQHGWARREGHELSVACDTDDNIWRFECVGTTWEGPTGTDRNCTSGGYTICPTAL